MKIAQIAPYFLPHTGGVERYVYNLSKYLINEGHMVEVITSNVPEGRTFDTIDGIPVRRLKCIGEPCIGEPLRNPLVPSIVPLPRIIRGLVIGLEKYLMNFVDTVIVVDPSRLKQIGMEYNASTSDVGAVDFRCCFTSGKRLVRDP